MSELNVIKIGGNIIDNEDSLKDFLKDFSQIVANKVLIHGGGKIATEISKKLGIEAQMVEGKRITDAETLKIVTMVYGGLINKNIVAQLQALGCNALGLTGADANLVLAKKRDIKNNIDYGFVGDPQKVNTNALEVFISGGLTPVIAPLTHDGMCSILNTNADTMASALAVGASSIYKVRLIYCFELKGVLENIDDKDSVIPTIKSSEYEYLKEKGIISKGMIPKLDGAFDAIKSGVNSVVICHASELKAIVDGQTKGTTLIN